MKRSGAVDDRNRMTRAGRGRDHLLEASDILADRRHPVGVDAIEHELSLALAKPRFVQLDRARGGSEHGIHRVEDWLEVKHGGTVVARLGGGDAHHFHSVYALAR